MLPQAPGLYGASGWRKGRVLTKVQQAVLVESPAAAAYELWRDVEAYPTFFEGVANVVPVSTEAYSWQRRGADGSEVEWVMRLVEDDAPSRLRWENESAPENDCLVTFAALEGDACWMVLRMESDLAAPAIPGPLDEEQRTERVLERTLLNAREIIEAAYHSGNNGRRS